MRKTILLEQKGVKWQCVYTEEHYWGMSMGSDRDQMDNGI
jgi:hypothetical protein